MRNKTKWFLAAVLAAMIAGSAIAMAAVPPEQPEKSQIGQTATAATPDKRMCPGKHMRHKFDNSALLQLLKMDKPTLQQELKAGKSILQIATERGVSEQQLVDLFTQQMQQRIEAGVKAGRITPEKAEAMKAKIPQLAEKMIKQSPIKFGKQIWRVDRTELLALLKADGQTLRAELKSGKTLLDIAAERGVSKQALTDFYTKQISQHIDEAVKTGRITAEKAEQLKANMATHVERFLSHKPMSRNCSTCQ